MIYAPSACVMQRLKYIIVTFNIYFCGNSRRYVLVFLSGVPYIIIFVDSSALTSNEISPLHEFHSHFLSIISFSFYDALFSLSYQDFFQIPKSIRYP